MDEQTEKSRASGFASMESQRQREIARRGGIAAHRKGTAHEFTSDEARNAGRKGGERVSANRSHMVEIGRLGGQRSAQRRKNQQQNPKMPSENPETDHSKPNAGS
jgi:uncharacterized protein